MYMYKYKAISVSLQVRFDGCTICFTVSLQSLQSAQPYIYIYEAFSVSLQDRFDGCTIVSTVSLSVSAKDITKRYRSVNGECTILHQSFSQLLSSDRLSRTSMWVLLDT